MRADLSNDLTLWLADCLAEFPPPESIVAYNVGLFETDEGFCAYLAGAAAYDADDDNWAVDPPYKPAYFPLPSFAYPFDGWEACLENVISSVSSALASPSLSTISGANAVTVGFDDGDLHRIK